MSRGLEEQERNFLHEMFGQPPEEAREEYEQAVGAAIEAVEGLLSILESDEYRDEPVTWGGLAEVIRSAISQGGGA